jgi:hypothetical protein
LTSQAPSHGRGPRRRVAVAAAGCLAFATAATMAMAGTALAGTAPHTSAASTVPSAPLYPAAFADGAGKLLVNWTAPASSGSGDLESYLLNVSDAAGRTWFVESAVAPGAASSTVVGGLQPGISYTVTVAAQNAAGVGPRSVASNPAEVEGAPDAPLDVTLTAVKGDQLRVDWQTPPGNGAPVTRTVVALYTAAGKLVSTTTVLPPDTGVGLPTTIGGTLPDGRGYYVQLRDANRFGTSNPTADSAIVTTSAAGSPSPTPVTAPPPFAQSDYVLPAVDTPAGMRAMGCAQAKAESGPEQGRGRIVLLDFGGQYGTRSVLLIPPPSGPAPLTELTYAQVVADAEAYATGYHGCVAAGAGPLTVGITTNNSLNVTRELGVEWARDVVNPAAAWAKATYPGQVIMAASNDMEPGFGAAEAARAWTAGYVSAADGNVYYNSGSADGCNGTTLTGACNNGWTVGDEYAVNAGLSNRLIESLPQIYTESGIMADQWQGISNAGPAAGLAPVNFAGELTQYTTCLIPGLGPCTGIDNTPAQGWGQLYADLNSSPITAQESLPWSTDITYSPTPAAGNAAFQPRFVPEGDAADAGVDAGAAVPWCASNQLAMRFDGHGQYGDRPLTYYPFLIANTSNRECKIASAQGVTAVTHTGAGLNLTTGHGGVQLVTVLAPHAYTGFALGLSDYGTRCQYLRGFSVTLPHLAKPVSVPITGMDGGAAVCGDRASVLTALR